MRKLLKMLKNWNLKYGVKFNKYQRKMLFEFITEEFVREVKKNNG